MRDWVQAFKLPFQLLVLLFFLPLLIMIFVHASQAPPILIAITLPPLILFFAFAFLGALWSQFAGIVFDGRNDTLIYPAYSIRRSIVLSEINDANCEFSSGPVFGTLVAFVLNMSGQSPKSKPSKMYLVNLSGAFGSRQVRFAAKKRRDQFLSLLRRYVPSCRITRWPGGS
jgi:hypothetical protein